MKTTRRPVATSRLSVPARCFARLIIFSMSLAVAAQLHAKPLKVFILAGQSNMEGHAKIETFDYIGDDPATAPLLKQMRGADGKPTVCDGAWISYFTGSGDANGEGLGKLTAGYGSRQKPDKDGGKIGPEFTFGLSMDAALDEPVLIIKTAREGFGRIRTEDGDISHPLQHRCFESAMKVWHQCQDLGLSKAEDDDLAQFIFEFQTTDGKLGGALDGFAEGHGRMTGRSLSPP